MTMTASGVENKSQHKINKDSDEGTEGQWKSIWKPSWAHTDKNYVYIMQKSLKIISIPYGRICVELDSPKALNAKSTAITSHQLWISPSKKEKKWSHMKVRHDFQNSKGLVQTQKQTCLDYFGDSAKHRKTFRWGAKTQQADLESRYATAITASVNALFCSCVLAFKALTLNAAASHASHPYWTGEGTALQTQLIRFHSWHFWHC